MNNKRVKLISSTLTSGIPHEFYFIKESKRLRSPVLYTGRLRIRSYILIDVYMDEAIALYRRDPRDKYIEARSKIYMFEEQ